MCVRVHISLDAKLVKRLDRKVGKRRRSAYIRQLVERSLEDEQRRRDILSAIGSISDTGHVWDPDPAAWVHADRRSDPRRTG